MSKYQCGYNGPYINSAFAIELCNNGERADARVSLKAAPILDCGTEELIAVYLGTNGNPVWIATITPTGNIEISAQTEEPDAWQQCADEFCDGDAEGLEEYLIDALVTAKIVA